MLEICARALGWTQGVRLCFKAALARGLGVLAAASQETLVTVGGFGIYVREYTYESSGALGVQPLGLVAEPVVGSDVDDAGVEPVPFGSDEVVEEEPGCVGREVGVEVERPVPAWPAGVGEPGEVVVWLEEEPAQLELCVRERTGKGLLEGYHHTFSTKVASNTPPVVVEEVSVAWAKVRRG